MIHILNKRKKTQKVMTM